MSAAQEVAHQLLRTLKIGIVHDPYAAHIEWQLAPTAREIFSAHHGVDTVRLQKAAHEMRFRCVFGDVNLFHCGKREARLLHSHFGEQRLRSIVLGAQDDCCSQMAPQPYLNASVYGMAFASWAD
jgi:hypothetical protein